MTRRMSVSMTLEAVRARQKTVTRRHVDTWRTLAPGDRLTLIEKGMGLPKGAKQVTVAEVEVVDVRVEPIRAVTPDEIRLEGFDPDEWTSLTWATWWAGGHGYPIRIHPGGWSPLVPGDLDDIECRRIEWRYLDEAAVAS